MIEVPISDLKEGDHYLLELRNHRTRNRFTSAEVTIPSIKAKGTYHTSYPRFELTNFKMPGERWENLYQTLPMNHPEIYKIYYDTALNKDRRYEEKFEIEQTNCCSRKIRGM